MNLNEWLNEEIPGIAKALEDINKSHFFIEKTIGFAGKETIYKVLYDFRSALFPGVYDKYPIDETRINIIIGNRLRTSALDLKDLIQKVLLNKRAKADCAETRTECYTKADEIVIQLLKLLPDIRQKIQTDIQAAYDGDPAASSTEEILLSYPSVEAISIHRIAHELYKLDVPIIPRIMAEYAHQLTGIDIHPGASIGEYFFIDHGTGVVIGETCTIGRHVKIYQGVTLGAKSFPLDEHGNPIKGIKRHPNIEDHVVIYAGATILGGDTTIGHNSVIGGNIWLTQSVLPYSKVYNSQPSPNIK
ncbi:serine acetyltransferase [Paenibacillus sp. GYB004]|uniref:serine O-acetyltransferase EpsC n=1 Tax=Paenibacillus sp. GYB004 TaxID=2994393 RepID=UPI002F9628B9